MKPYEKNLELARTICKEIKLEAVCSNDIIPRNEMPVITEAMIPDVKRRFGSDKVDAYIRHMYYLDSARKITALASESLRMIGPIPSAAIAVARLGVGECGELSTLAFIKLIELGRQDVAIVAVEGQRNELHRTNSRFNHAFILLGINDDRDCLKESGDIRQLNALSRNIVILDPFLNHVGRAADYLNDQSAYVAPFGYDKVVSFDRATQDHIDNCPLIENNARQLIADAETKGVFPFDRSLCDLPLANNPSLKKNRCEDTTFLRGLKARSGLPFWGMTDKTCYVDAVVEIHSDNEAATAKGIQDRLGAGCFYTGLDQRGRDQRFFVIPGINVRVSAGKDLPLLIHNLYCK